MSKRIIEELRYSSSVFAEKIWQFCLNVCNSVWVEAFVNGTKPCLATVFWCRFQKISRSFGVLPIWVFIPVFSILRIS